MIAAQAWLLDLTRTVSRLGRGPATGIDRVELAYLQHLCARPEPMFGLVRTALGFVVLDGVGVTGMLDRALGHRALGKADLLGLLTQRHLPQRVQAEADARRLAVARCLPSGLARQLRKILPQGVVYVNVGHANLSLPVMRAVKSVAGAAVVVLVHDTIPLDHPQYCRARELDRFAAKLRAVAEAADLVVHAAKVTRAQTEVHLAALGRVPPGVVAPLGVVVAAPKAGVTAKRPYFMALGTIEPRKNIGFLLEVWRGLQARGGPVPHLYLVGQRGWAAPDLFAQIAALEETGDGTLLDGLPDGAAMALLQGAEALLFPSLAEGFGIPPIEAAALGVPVMAGKLSVVVEMLSDYPVYLDTSDVYVWLDRIMYQLKHRDVSADAQRQIRVPPHWADHFEAVFGKAD